jgi:hypothetical protein
MDFALAVLPVFLLTSSLSAQVTYFSEDFSVFPMPGWSQVNYGTPGNPGWEYDAGGGRVFHNNHQTSSDHRLISPIVDLSNATSAYLHFDGEVENTYALLGFGAIEASADGGQSWTTIWRDQSSYDVPYSINVNLSSWLGAGASQVLFAIHYQGSFKHKWWVDNLVIDDQPVRNFKHSAGWIGVGFRSHILADGCSINGNVALAFSLTGTGPTMTQFGLVDMSIPIYKLSSDVSDNQCLASLSFTPPLHASGVTLYTQGVDLRTGTLSDLVVVVIP